MILAKGVDGWRASTHMHPHTNGAHGYCTSATLEHKGNKCSNYTHRNSHQEVVWALVRHLLLLAHASNHLDLAPQTVDTRKVESLAKIRASCCYEHHRHHHLQQQSRRRRRMHSPPSDPSSSPSSPT